MTPRYVARVSKGRVLRRQMTPDEQREYEASLPTGPEVGPERVRRDRVARKLRERRGSNGRYLLERLDRLEALVARAIESGALPLDEDG